MKFTKNKKFKIFLQEPRVNRPDFEDNLDFQILIILKTVGL